MREYDLTQFPDGEPAVYGDTGERDYLGAGIANNMHSQHPAFGTGSDNLAQSLSPLILCDEAAGIGEWQLKYIDLEPSCYSFGLGEPYAGDFRIGIDDTGDGIVAHPGRQAEDVIDGHLCFTRGCMCQH